MSFLTINGVAIPVAPDSFQETEREVGLSVFAQNGLLRKSRQAVKRDIGFQTIPLTQSDALIWTYLLDGGGDGWTLGGYYSWKGSPLTVALGAVITGGQLVIPAAGSPGTAVFGYTFPSTGSWTIMVRRLINNVQDGYYIIRSDGSKWKDGAVFGGATTWLSASTVSATITGLTGASPANDTQYQNFWAFPYAVPNSWIAGLYADHLANGTFPSPTMRVFDSGILQQPALSVRRSYLGTVESEKNVRGNLGGVLYKNLRILTVKLTEV